MLENNPLNDYISRNFYITQPQPTSALLFIMTQSIIKRGCSRPRIFSELLVDHRVYKDEDILDPVVKA